MDFPIPSYANVVKPGIPLVTILNKMLARSVLRISGVLGNQMRFMSEGGVDKAKTVRDRRAQIELDPFDNPYLDVES